MFYWYFSALYTETYFEQFGKIAVFRCKMYFKILCLSWGYNYNSFFFYFWPLLLIHKPNGAIELEIYSCISSQRRPVANTYSITIYSRRIYPGLLVTPILNATQSNISTRLNSLVLKATQELKLLHGNLSTRLNSPVLKDTQSKSQPDLTL